MDCITLLWALASNIHVERQGIDRVEAAMVEGAADMNSSWKGRSGRLFGPLREVNAPRACDVVRCVPTLAQTHPKISVNYPLIAIIILVKKSSPWVRLSETKYGFIRS